MTIKVSPYKMLLATLLTAWMLGTNLQAQKLAVSIGSGTGELRDYPGFRKFGFYFAVDQHQWGNLTQLSSYEFFNYGKYLYTEGQDDPYSIFTFGAGLNIHLMDLGKGKRQQDPIEEKNPLDIYLSCWLAYDLALSDYFIGISDVYPGLHVGARYQLRPGISAFMEAGRTPAGVFAAGLTFHFTR